MKKLKKKSKPAISLHFRPTWSIVEAKSLQRKKHPAKEETLKFTKVHWHYARDPRYVKSATKNSRRYSRYCSCYHRGIHIDAGVDSWTKRTLLKPIRLNRGDCGGSIHIHASFDDGVPTSSGRTTLGAAGLRRRPLSPSPSSLFVHWHVRCPCQWTRNLLHQEENFVTRRTSRRAEECPLSSAS